MANSPQNNLLPSEIKPNRTKVALKPGHSLMDWIRLTNSGKDLTGVNGRFIKVSPEELAQHCTPNNAWIALKGKVYNITHYMDYHPGGPLELMRGVGKDATDLFNEIHRWVNFESMLKKCLVGKLVGSAVNDLNKVSGLTPGNATLFLKPPDPSPMIPLNKEVSSSSAMVKVPTAVPSQPRYTWEQDDQRVIITITCSPNQGFSIHQESIILDLQEQRDIRIQLHLHGPANYYYVFHLELQEKVALGDEVKCNEQELTLSLVKQSPGAIWADLGSPLSQHNTLTPEEDKAITFRKCCLKSKEAVSRDSYLFCFELPEGARLAIPTGHHVHLQLDIQGTEVTRSYTPLPSSLTAPIPNRCSPLLHFIIKIYPTGTLTPVLDQVEIGNDVSISGPEGSFDTGKLRSCTRVVMLAAGTGFTPMAGILGWLFLNPLPEDTRLVKLMFFNKTQEDILWKDQLEDLSNSLTVDNDKKSPFKLEVVNILSEPLEGWAGPKGRIRRALLESHLPPAAAEPMIFVCGPKPFTSFTLRLLSELHYDPEHIHAFDG